METNGTTREEQFTMQAIQGMYHKIQNIELRDIFAMQVLPGIMTNYPVLFSNMGLEKASEHIAEMSYKIADAMLKTRKEKNEQ